MSGGRDGGTWQRRGQWESLPAELRREVECRTGRVSGARSVPEGMGGDLLAVLETPTGPVFAKGMVHDNDQIWAQQIEADLAPFVASLGARLLWRVQAAGWDVTGWEYLPGRLADYRPGSPDLPKVAEVLRTLATMTAPDCLEIRAVWKWGRYVSDPSVFDGEHLVHGDLNSANVIVNGAARLVDWGWSVRGAPWITAGLWVARLVVQGHSPHDAEEWASRVPAWSAAYPAALTSLAEALRQQWEEGGHQCPGPATDHMNRSLSRWVAHRHGRR